MGKRTAKRDLFAELVEGFDALAEARTGKLAPRAHARAAKPFPHFEELKESIRQAGRIRRGELRASREFHYREEEGGDE